MWFRLGGEIAEGFYFQNNWSVHVDYGMNFKIMPLFDYDAIDESALPSEDDLFCREGRSSDHFRILKLFKDENLVSKVRF